MYPTRRFEGVFFSDWRIRLYGYAYTNELIRKPRTQSVRGFRTQEYRKLLTTGWKGKEN